MNYNDFAQEVRKKKGIAGNGKTVRGRGAEKVSEITVQVSWEEAVRV